MEETATGTDANDAGFLYLGTVTESATIADTTSTDSTSAGVIQEFATGADVTEALGQFLRTVLESCQALDNVQRSGAQESVVVESSTATDTVIAQGLWGDINTTQTASWQPVTI